MTPPVTVAQAFINSVQRHRNRTAIVEADGKRFTYADLFERTSVAVSILRKLGCGVGDRVAILLPNSIEWVALEFACALIGCTIVPLNLRYRAGEIEYSLAHGKARVLFLQRRYLTNDLLGRVAEIGDGVLGDGELTSLKRLPELKHVVMMHEEDKIEGVLLWRALERNVKRTDPDEMRVLARERQANDILWIFWTSGTTSSPKGVVIDQSAVTNIWEFTTKQRYSANDRIVTTQPFYYIAGNFWALITTMLHGATLVMAPTLALEEIIRQIGRERATVLNNTMLIKQILTNQIEDIQIFESVRLVVIGGVRLPESDFHQMKEKLRGAAVVQIYGMTELHGFACCTAFDDPIELTARSCGKPLPGFAFRLVDPQTRKPVAVGEIGELLVKGPRLVRYEATRQKLEAFDSEGWFHTGDLMRVDENGYYDFVSRSKDVIKVGGESVAAAEIEAVVLTNSGVARAAVIPAPNSQYGEVPIAFVVRRPNALIEEQDLRAFCRERMAPFKVPAAFVFLLDEEMPVTVSNKVAKGQLAEMLATRATSAIAIALKRAGQ